MAKQVTHLFNVDQSEFEKQIFKIKRKGRRKGTDDLQHLFDSV
jgi:hypothetical protein